MDFFDGDTSEVFEYLGGIPIEKVNLEMFGLAKFTLYGQDAAVMRTLKF
ncbi:MAG: hypothetical protein ACKVU0_20885 [Saprospiraceae bacterium]